MSNMFKTALLLVVLTVLLVLIGGAIGGQQGMLVAFVLALVMNFFTYWFSDKMVLAMYRARPIEESQAPALYRIVRTLATRGGIPMPRVYLIPSETPNAFATGRNPQHAAVAVTEGSMRILDEEELEGVLAHELSHVKNRDVLIATIAATLAGGVPDPGPAGRPVPAPALLDPPAHRGADRAPALDARLISLPPNGSKPA